MTQDARTLAREGVKVVRFLYADLHGVARGKDIPVGALDEYAERGLPFCSAVLATDLRHTPVVEEDERFGDLVARPDLATLRILPWQPDVAWCVADLWRPDGSARWPSCPRGALAGTAERYAERGLRPILAPELEFFLLAPDSSAPRGYRRYVDGRSRVYTVGYVSDPQAVVVDMLDACERLGLQATTATHEFSNSQYEITVGHSAPVDAGDRGFLLKAAVKELAARAGLTATFMGKPFNDQGGSGFHVHLSLENAADGVLRRFVAGVLAHAPALTALLAPTVNAYRRLAEEPLAPNRADWDHDNRLAFVRVPSDRDARIEVRAGDGAANPYLALAALLAAGLDGIERALEPPPPRVPGAPLPRDLGAALDRLEADDELVAALGGELVAAFVRLKRSEVERFNAWVSDWELDEYADHL